MKLAKAEVEHALDNLESQSAFMNEYAYNVIKAALTKALEIVTRGNPKPKKEKK
jgi:hypothetical protein